MDPISAPAVHSWSMEHERVGEVVPQHLGPEPDVVSVYLFGSTARGEERRDSDIDLEGDPSCAAPATLDLLPVLRQYRRRAVS